MTGGPDFIEIYSVIGIMIFGILWFKVFITEGIHVASGDKSELPKILVKWIFVAALFLLWGGGTVTIAGNTVNASLANAIWSGASSLAQLCFPNIEDIFRNMTSAMTNMSAQQVARAEASSWISSIVGAIAEAGSNIMSGIMSLVGILVLFLCYMLILINIAGSLAILAMNLVIAPVFFGLAFDKDFRSPAMSWFTAVLSYVLLMPMYGLAIRMAASVAGSAIPAANSAFPTTGQIAAQLLGPFLALGIVFSANKVVSMLVGGGAGGGLGRSVLGGAMGAAAMLGVTGKAAAAAGKVVTNTSSGSGGNAGGGGNSGGSGGNAGGGGGNANPTVTAATGGGS